jgi:energy-coupling factor transport system ATP-binding protein
VLELLEELGRERVLLVVTHEPELFTDRVEPQQSWRLEQGVLRPLERHPEAQPLDHDR